MRIGLGSSDLLVGGNTDGVGKEVVCGRSSMFCVLLGLRKGRVEGMVWT